VAVTGSSFDAQSGGNVTWLATGARSPGLPVHLRLASTAWTEFLPAVSVVATDYVADEASNTGTVTFTRTGSPTLSLTANVDITGTATNGVDYTTINSTVVFAAGSATATVTVTGLEDELFGEGTETVIFTVASGSGYVAAGSPATVYISDALAAVVTVVATTDTTSEGAAPGVFTVSRTGSTDSPS